MAQRQEIFNEVKLLMITRKVDKNDWLAGFAYYWVKKIGEKVENLKVICLEKGDISGLPQNIEIYSLGKEKNNNRFARFFKFQELAFRLALDVDGIFCHMNPEYTIAIWPYAKIFGKKIISWYTHGAVSWRTRILAILADKILTASKESFRINSNKVIITGHGINLDFFKPIGEKKKQEEIFKILSVGRISPTKDYETLIKAIDFLVNKEKIKDIKTEIIGAPGLLIQANYFESLKKMVVEMNLGEFVKFWGALPPQEAVKYYQNADLFVNLSGTGSIDKTVLEAMACGCLVLTSNEAFFNILDKDFLVEKNQPEKLAQKIKSIMNLSFEERNKISKKFEKEVFENHNLNNLAEKIVDSFK